MNIAFSCFSFTTTGGISLPHRHHQKAFKQSRAHHPRLRFDFIQRGDDFVAVVREDKEEWNEI